MNVVKAFLFLAINCAHDQRVSNPLKSILKKYTDTYGNTYDIKIPINVCHQFKIMDSNETYIQCNYVMILTLTRKTTFDIRTIGVFSRAIANISFIITSVMGAVTTFTVTTVGYRIPTSLT